MDCFGEYHFFVITTGNNVLCKCGQVNGDGICYGCNNYLSYCVCGYEIGDDDEDDNDDGSLCDFSNRILKRTGVFALYEDESFNAKFGRSNTSCSDLGETPEEKD